MCYWYWPVSIYAFCSCSRSYCFFLFLLMSRFYSLHYVLHCSTVLAPLSHIVNKTGRAHRYREALRVMRYYDVLSKRLRLCDEALLCVVLCQEKRFMWKVTELSAGCSNVSFREGTPCRNRQRMTVIAGVGGKCIMSEKLKRSNDQQVQVLALAHFSHIWGSFTTAIHSNRHEITSRRLVKWVGGCGKMEGLRKSCSIGRAASLVTVRQI